MAANGINNGINGVFNGVMGRNGGVMAKTENGSKRINIAANNQPIMYINEKRSVANGGNRR
jgi:hypothetical protein